MPVEAKKTTAALILVSREIVIPESVSLHVALADYHPVQEGLLERFLDLDLVGTPRTFRVTGATFGIRTDAKRRTFRQTYDLYVNAGNGPVDIFALLEVGMQFLSVGDDRPIYGTRTYRDSESGNACFPYILAEGERKYLGFCDADEAEQWPGMLIFQT